MRRFAALVPRGGAILDIGCGSGRPLAEHFIREGYEVVGIDSSPTLIDACKERFPEQSWFVSDMRELSMQRKFQGLIAWDSFFHLAHEDPECGGHTVWLAQAARDDNEVGADSG